MGTGLGWGRRFGAAAALCLPALPAAAQIGVAEPGYRDPFLWAALFVFCLTAALTVAVRASQRSRRIEREHRHLKQETRALEAILDFSPGAHVLWQGSVCRASRGAGALLGYGAGTAMDVERLVGCFDPVAASVLRQAIEALRRDATPFELTLPLAHSTGMGGRLMHLLGRCRDGAEAAGPIAVLWLADVTTARADAAARVERDRLVKLLDALPFPLWQRDEDLGIVYCNAAYARTLDLTPAEVIARQAEIARGVIAEGGRALARRARALGAEQSESQHLVVAGARRLFEFFERPLPDGSLASHALDVTGLEATQAELVRHVGAHADVLEQLSTGVVIFGPDSRVAFFNTAYADLFGLTEDFLRAEPPMAEVIEAMRERRRIPEHADFPRFKREIQRQLMSVIAPTEELVHLPDETTLRQVTAPHPFGGILIVYEDVTDRIALERSYNTLIAVQRETIDNLAEGVAVFGGDGRLKLSNPAFARLWGLDASLLNGDPHITAVMDGTRGLFPDDGDWAATRGRLVTQVTEREAVSERLERPDGRVLHMSSVPLPDGGMLLTHVDIGDSLRVERALRERNAALETADRLKSEFLANVSYELRTPLTSIVGFAEILDQQYFGPLNERQKEYANGLVEASNRLMALINNILDIATIEAGYMTLERAAVDIAAMLERLKLLVGERVANRGLTLRLDCPADVGAVIGDERRLTQALFNLVSNAINFTPARGHIEVAARRQDGTLVLTVADTGVGMAPEDQAELFQKFATARRAGAESGAGLGLALVKRLIELHGGSVALESKPGAGTRVTCRVPCEPPASID
jgi:signal transduction histidine kinase